jgi:oligogalacturonide transport system permease protein
MVGQKKWLPYVLLGPWFIGLIIFKIYPFINSFILSLYDYNLMDVKKAKTFVGLDNYIKLFSSKAEDMPIYGIFFVDSLVATFKYVALTVPLVLIISLFVAFILNFKLKGIGFFRTAYYIPSILGANVAIAIFWRFLFESNGLINGFLSIFNIRPVNWLTEATPAMIVISLLRVWQFGSTMVIFLAALQNVPATLYESAIIDGASKWRMFFSITIPMISPTILFNGVMRLIEAFQVFNGPMLITNGGPVTATYMINLYIYNAGFKSFEMGAASAMSWILFIIIMLFTIVIFRSSKYWTYYSD